MKNFQFMKKAFVLGVLSGALAVTSLVAGPTSYSVQTVDGYGPWQTGVGGEFTLASTDSTIDGIINGYYSGAKNQVAGYTSFETFCVEGSEYIYADSPYSVVFAGTSVYTGGTLTKGAAYLYSQFASGGNFGGLATYSYANSPSGTRNTSAGLLQDAIWAFMGQEGQTFANNSSNPFLQAADKAIGGNVGSSGFTAADAAGGAGFDGVSILNMWVPGEVNVSGYQRQDQLIWAPSGPHPVPDGGLTIAMLGMSLSGLGMLYRRRR